MLITEQSIIRYAQYYDEHYKDTKYETVEKRMKKWLMEHHVLTKVAFLNICLWKSKRPKKHYESNSASLIRDLSSLSFSSSSEEARIQTLLILKGVSYPIASAILHFGFPDKYPILDFRVIWSLGWEQPGSYTFSFWEKYCTSRLHKASC